MNEFVPDKSGINSLGGFAYQIKVFVLYMLSMDENMQVEFETIDDVSTRIINPETIDVNEDSFRNSLLSLNGITAIQVKRTTITESTAKNILLNWILLESFNENVIEYILYTDDLYKNRDIIFNISKDDLYLEILNSKKSKKSTIAKIKSKYQNDKKKFDEVYSAIKSKYTFISSINIDDKIDEKCKILFKKGGINNITYYNRIKELLKHITFEIMKSINEKTPFIIRYNEMIAYAEDICSRFTDEFMYPVYSEFKKLNKIDFSDLNIASSREFNQLKACNLPQKMIETHLLYSIYYRNMCYQYLELNKVSKIRNIEETAFENFEEARFYLQYKGSDSPLERLLETKKRQNSYADNDQIKYGVEIYLTRKEETEHQISWEDNDNAKT